MEELERKIMQDRANKNSTDKYLQLSESLNNLSKQNEIDKEPVLSDYYDLEMK